MHNVGSLIVIFNSARLVRKGEELEHYHPAPAPPQPERPAAPTLKAERHRNWPAPVFQAWTAFDNIMRRFSLRVSGEPRLTPM